MPKRRDKQDKTLSKHITVFIDTYQAVLERMEKEKCDNLSDFIDKALKSYLKEKDNISAHKSLQQQLRMLSSFKTPVETAGVYWMMYSPWLDRDCLRNLCPKIYGKWNRIEKQKIENQFFDSCNTIKKSPLRGLFEGTLTEEDYITVEKQDKEKFKELNKKILDYLEYKPIKIDDGRLYTFNSPLKRQKYARWLELSKLIDKDKIILVDGTTEAYEDHLLCSDYFWGVKIAL